MTLQMTPLQRARFEALLLNRSIPELSEQLAFVHLDEPEHDILFGSLVLLHRSKQ